MNCHSLRSILLLLTSLIFVGRADCSVTDDAQKQLKTWVDQVVDVASHAADREVLRAKVRPILEHCINFDSMTRRAIGPGWRQFTPDQQREAIRLFTTLIIRTYTAKFTPGEVPSTTYKGSFSTTPGRVEITTSSLYKGSHYDIVYRLEQGSTANTQGWRITDIVIEGVSMVANYRTQFDSEFQQGGAASVIKSLTHSVNDPK